MTREKCYEYLKRKIGKLDGIPKYMLDEDMCKYAVECDERSISYVPEEYVTYEMWMSVLKRRGEMYVKLPERFKGDREMCRCALDSYPLAIKWMDRNDDVLGVLALKSYDKLSSERVEIAEYIPDTVETNELLEKLYASNHYIKMGTIRVCLKDCSRDDVKPCTHWIIDENRQERKNIKAIDIVEILQRQGIYVPHFKQYYRSDFVAIETIGENVHIQRVGYYR